MSIYLGIDTSNYTTSAALYCNETGTVISEKQLLPVNPGELGLRQSDAVFHHVRQLPIVLERLFALQSQSPCAVGFSARPRDEEGSYMPCFLAGECSAKAAAISSHIPAYAFSHQAGHIAAALYSVGRLDLLNDRFIAFHVSGGTTECLLVSPGKERIIDITCVAHSLDLKAGQVIDRVGGMLGLSFPAGMELDELSRQSTRVFSPKPMIKGSDCCLSGVENQCARMLSDGIAPCDIARYCIDYIMAALSCMTESAIQTYGKLPLVFAGGVMSNSIMSETLSRRFNGLFASPALSSDNAAGTAILCCIGHTGGTSGG